MSMNNSNNLPKVSVILPTYNGEDYVKRAVESVLRQDGVELELIVVNDASTDGTLEVVKSCAAKDSRIKIIANETNLKLPTNLNKGFQAAEFEYVTWISDDNEFKPGALKYMATHLASRPETDLISCAMDFVDEAGGFIKNNDTHPTRKSQGFLAAFCNIGGCFMFKKEVFKLAGYYKTDISCGEDHEFWCRVALNCKIDYDSTNLFKYYVRKGAMSETRKDELLRVTAELHSKYAEQLLKKHPLKGSALASVYYQIYKVNPKNKAAMKKAFQSAFFYSLVKFALLFLRGLKK